MACDETEAGANFANCHCLFAFIENANVSARAITIILTQCLSMVLSSI